MLCSKLNYLNQEPVFSGRKNRGSRWGSKWGSRWGSSRGFRRGPDGVQMGSSRRSSRGPDWGVHVPTHFYVTLYWFGSKGVLEITSSPNTSLVSNLLFVTKLTKNLNRNRTRCFSTLNYRSFLIVNVFYVNVINLSLKLSYVNLFGRWLLSRSLSRYEFPFLTRTYE